MRRRRRLGADGSEGSSQPVRLLLPTDQTPHSRPGNYLGTVRAKTGGGASGRRRNGRVAQAGAHYSLMLPEAVKRLLRASLPFGLPDDALAALSAGAQISDAAPGEHLYLEG